MGAVIGAGAGAGVNEIERAPASAAARTAAARETGLADLPGCAHTRAPTGVERERRERGGGRVCVGGGPFRDSWNILGIFLCATFVPQGE